MSGGMEECARREREKKQQELAEKELTDLYEEYFELSRKIRSIEININEKTRALRGCL